MKPHKLRFYIVFLCSILFTSCSLYRLGLHYFEFIATREVAKVFDLSSSQKSDVRKVIDQNMLWLKKEWLTDYLNVLNGFHDQWSDGLSSDEITVLFERTQQQRTLFVAKIAPQFMPIVNGLNATNREAASEYFTERQQKQVDALAKNEASFRKFRKTKLVESVAWWYGKLNEEQQERLCSIFDCGKGPTQVFLNRSKIANTFFLESIANIPVDLIWVQKMVSWSQNPKSLYDDYPEYQTQLDFKLTASKISAMDQVMSSEQRSVAQRKLKELIDDLTWFIKHES